MKIQVAGHLQELVSCTTSVRPLSRLELPLTNPLLLNYSPILRIAVLGSLLSIRFPCYSVDNLELWGVEDAYKLKLRGILRCKKSSPQESR